MQYLKIARLIGIKGNAIALRVKTILPFQKLDPLLIVCNGIEIVAFPDEQKVVVLFAKFKILVLHLVLCLHLLFRKRKSLAD